jgi:hypothetical protein
MSEYRRTYKGRYRTQCAICGKTRYGLRPPTDTRCRRCIAWLVEKLGESAR